MAAGATGMKEGRKGERVGTAARPGGGMCLRTGRRTADGASAPMS